MKASNSSASRLFVTGTDTGIGKTVLSLLLMQFLYRRGYNPCYVKLIQTGCTSPYDAESDARFIYDHVPELSGKARGDSVLYCFRNPKAPYFAARDEGKEIDLQILKQSLEERIASRSPVIIEGAGGLLVPVTAHVLMIDLIPLLGAKPILAARAGLGTINHTLLSIEALRARGMEPAGVVLMDFQELPTSPEMIGENIEAVETIGKVRVAGVIGRISDFSNPDDECYAPLCRLLKNLSPDDGGWSYAKPGDLRSKAHWAVSP